MWIVLTPHSEQEIWADYIGFRSKSKIAKSFRSCSDACVLISMEMLHAYSSFNAVPTEPITKLVQ